MRALRREIKFGFPRSLLSKRLYRERNLIERFVSNLKQFRLVAPHDDKVAANCLVMIQLASIRRWIRVMSGDNRRTMGCGAAIPAPHS